MDEGSQQGIPNPASPPPAPRRSQLMLVLCYIGLLSIIPYLAVKDDDEVRFHARQGLALGLIGIGAAALAAIPFIHFFGAIGIALVVILSVLGIVKALSGSRWRMPVAADLADRLEL